MREGRGQFEDRFDRLRSPPEDQAQCVDNFPGSTFACVRRGPVFHAAANASASEQPARFQSAQVLTGSRHRQVHALGDSGHGLVRLPNQKSECLQAFAVGHNAAGAPKRRLSRRRPGGSHVHTLQSMTNWSTLRFESSRRRVDPSDPGRHDGRYLLRVADVRRAGAFLAGARVLAAGLALPFPLPMASRMA
jgi:hypothetical protein